MSDNVPDEEYGDKEELMWCNVEELLKLYSARGYIWLG